MGDSGRNLGWNSHGEKRTIPNEFRESLLRLPRIEIRADNRGFHKPDSFLNRSCVARSLKRTPLFAETIFCLAVIMGWIGESGHDPGLNDFDYPTDPAIPERFPGEIL